MKNIKDIMKAYKLDAADISTKFGIPLRTVYSWIEDTRKPPEYVITMMLNIILLERKIKSYGYTEERLEKGMGRNRKTVSKAGKKS